MANLSVQNAANQRVAPRHQPRSATGSPSNTGHRPARQPAGRSSHNAGEIAQWSNGAARDDLKAGAGFSERMFVTPNRTSVCDMATALPGLRSLSGERSAPEQLLRAAGSWLASVQLIFEGVENGNLAEVKVQWWKTCRLDGPWEPQGCLRECRRTHGGRKILTQKELR